MSKDPAQFNHLAYFVKPASTLLFLNCNNGEEIVDCQTAFSKKRGLTFFGLDSSPRVVDSANNRKYTFPTEAHCADFMADQINKQFDVVVCRNVLMYHDSQTRKKIVERLAELTKDVLMLGQTDPFDFPLTKTVKIKNEDFDVLDYENRILRKQPKLVASYM